MVKALSGIFLASLCLIIRYLPKRCLSVLTEFLSLFLGLMKKHRRRIGLNTNRVYRLPSHSDFSSKFGYQVLRHQLAAFFETAKELLQPGSLRIDGLLDYQSHMTELLNNNKGVVIVTGHLGSWELVARFGASASQGAFYALAKPARQPGLTTFMENLRKSAHVVPLWTGRVGLLREMLSTLRSNRPLGFVMDQKPDQRVGHAVEFLGQETLFASGPARIALRTEAPVLAVFCLRRGPWHYQIICHQVYYNSCNGSESQLTQQMADSISAMIRCYPEQWLWNYKRW